MRPRHIFLALEEATNLSADVRVLTPEEITASGGGQTPPFALPVRDTHFAERAMRLRQLSRGHALQGYLAFMADLAQVQQARLAQPVPVLPADAIGRATAAAAAGRPPLSAAEWPRDAAWHAELRALVADLLPLAPAGAQPTLQRLAAADGDFLEAQADCLLSGVATGLDLACAPVVGAALQVTWTRLLLALAQEPTAAAQGLLPYLDDRGLCPCCGSHPVASITRAAGDAPGQRYLQCSLCGLQWHMVRTRCSHCGSSEHISYQSLDTVAADADTGGRAALAALQAETCDDCGHYLKIMHSARDPFVEPVADDLASLTLDLLLSDAGKQRHGNNLMLLFGEPPPTEP
jgi:FdhE protein